MYKQQAKSGIMISFFHKIVDVLNTNHISYMLSGSVAMSVYILPRATRDFDFVVQLSPGDIEVFVKGFEEGYYCDADAVKDAVLRHSIFNIIDYNSGYKADFIVLKNEPFRIVEFNRKVQMDYFGRNIFLVTPEDLILSKLIWIQELRSAVQMEDIQNLSEIKALNWRYINDWISELKLNTFNLFT
ncbi:MAG: hypothetical protein ABIN67_19175 [Ferruginibacter sp.]